MTESADRVASLTTLPRFRPTTRSGWLAYAFVVVAVTATYLAILAAEGTIPADLGVMHLMLSLYAFAGPPAIAFFDRLARHAMTTARPTLIDDDVAYAALSTRLTTLPTRLGVLAGLGGLGTFVLLTIVQPADTNTRLHIFVTPVATVFELGFQLLVWISVGVVCFEIARKLWIIDNIYRHHLRVAVLRPGPVYAFARLAAAMVVFTIVAVAISSLALAELAGTVQWGVTAGAATLLAGTAFVAPLWGAHRLMAQEKERNLDELGERIASTIRDLRDRFDDRDLDAVRPLKDALDGLITARDEFEAVSTWPWQRSTLGGVVTALVVPLAIWLVTRLLEQGLLN